MFLLVDDDYKVWARLYRKPNIQVGLDGVESHNKWLVLYGPYNEYRFGADTLKVAVRKAVELFRKDDFRLVKQYA